MINRTDFIFGVTAICTMISGQSWMDEFGYQIFSIAFFVLMIVCSIFGVKERGVPVSQKITCGYCGQSKMEISFWIGAPPKNDDDTEWTLHEGTGKYSCPKCRKKGVVEAEAVIDTLRGK
ncbi:MAG: hypothetical protein IH948_10075 [Bacteroidetes bacterium]|nr:hypothetical protein [Bacteroidota bacterium]